MVFHSFTIILFFRSCSHLLLFSDQRKIDFFQRMSLLKHSCQTLLSCCLLLPQCIQVPGDFYPQFESCLSSSSTSTSRTESGLFTALMIFLPFLIQRLCFLQIMGWQLCVLPPWVSLWAHAPHLQIQDQALKWVHLRTIHQVIRFASSSWTRHLASASRWFIPLGSLFVIPSFP